jgi:hypothetical protein
VLVPRRRRRASSLSRLKLPQQCRGDGHPLLRPHESFNLTDQIPKLQWLVDCYGIDYTHMTVAEWRRLSGHQHGKVLASMLGSDRTIMARVEGGSQTTPVRPDKVAPQADSSTTPTRTARRPREPPRGPAYSPILPPTKRPLPRPRRRPKPATFKRGNQGRPPGRPRGTPSVRTSSRLASAGIALAA